MKIHIVVLLFVSISVICSQNDPLPKLYQLKGIEQAVELSGDENKKIVEQDIQNFQNIGPYKQTTFDKIDMSDKMAGVKVTQQILKQGDQKGAMEFFKIPEEVKNSAEMEKLGHINFEQFYDYETNSYLQKFNTPEALQSMKKLHEDYFTKQEQNANKPSAFFQQEAKNFSPRPKELPKDYRSSFISVSNKNKIYPLLHLWEFLDNKNCWASSRYEFGFVLTLYYFVPVLKWWYFIPYMALKMESYNVNLILFASYPCSTHTSGWMWWYWLSERIPSEKQMKEITFRLEFDTTKRLRYLAILFMTAPQQVRIESTQDMQNWEVAQEWQKSPDWWKYVWWWYTVRFDPMVYARGVKIIMKGYRDNFYGGRQGIWHIGAFSQQQTVMFLKKKEGDVPECMVRAENMYNFANKPMVLMNCFDAVMQNDAREIFFLDKLMVRQWADWMCVAPQLPNGNNPQYIVSQQCQDNEEQSFIIDRLGKVASRKYQDKCLAAQDDEKISQVQSYGFVTVSATIGDNRANPYNVVDPNGYGWWAPPIDISHAWIQVIFDRPYFIEKIIIKWKLKPPKFELQVLSPSNKWTTQIFESPEDDIELLLSPQQILGVKVLMMSLDQKSTDAGASGDAPVYGIKKIQILRPGTALSLQTCGAQEGSSKVMNRWKIDEVEYINIAFQIPYQMAMDYMEDQYQDSIKNIRIFMEKSTQFQQVLDTAQKIRDIIQQMMAKLQQMVITLEDLDKEVKSDKEADDDKPGYASSPKNPASSCGHIREHEPLKRNGYYWVKMKCMPEPERVFCDFDQNFPNFYVYKGFPNDKKSQIQDSDTPEGIRRHCGKIGLEPVVIKSEGVFLNILEYLEQSKSSSEDGYGIPISYRYDNGLFAKYKSFNNRESDGCFDAFKKYINKGFFDVVNILANSYVLIDNKKQVKLVNLKETKIRGVVCSANEPPPNPSNKKEIKINCQDNIQTVGAAVGSILAYRCPVGCGSVQSIPVYNGKENKFSEYSSICRSAAYMGLTKEEEETIIQVRVHKLTGNFDSQTGDQNNIKSVKCPTVTSKIFEFIRKSLSEECPNLDNNGKSFISFDEIMRKVESKKQSKHSSFIESNESDNIQDLAQIKAKSQVQDQIKAGIALSNSKDDDESSGGQKSMATSIIAIKSCRAGLKKKLAQTDNFLKYIEDSNKLISENTKKMESVYNSDLNPLQQEETVNTITKNIKEVKDKTQLTMDASIAKLRKAQDELVYQIEEYLKLKRYDPFVDKYKLNFEQIYQTEDSAQASPKSKWEYTHDNVYPHKQAITQPITISCKDNILNPTTECTASLLTVKFKVFFDFHLTIDFKATNIGGYSGIIFRRKDAFNYYSLDIGKEFIRFRKIINGKQSIISSSSIEGLLQDKWYNIDLKVKQNLFSAKFGLEKSDIPSKYNTIPSVLKGEDLYIKSGQMGLMTENVQGSMFDNFKVDHEDCYVDPFDSDKAKKYKVKTNRFHELYKNDINLIWQQSPKDNNPWVYKENFFGKKFAFYRKPDETDKAPPALLINKVFDIGTVAFSVLFSKSDAILFTFLYYTSSKENFAISISANKIKIVQIENNQPNALLTQKIKVKLFTWTQFYIEATDSLVTCSYFNADEDKMLPCYEKEISRPIKPQDYKIAFAAKNNEIAFDDLRIDLASAESLEKEVEEAQKDEEEGDEEQEDSFDLPDTDVAEQSVKVELQAKPDFNAPRFENTNSIDYQKCISTNTPDLRLSQCNEMYGGEKSITRNCLGNFCQFCCQSKFPPNMKAETLICEKECADAEKADDLNAFNNCVDPFDPGHSVLKFCVELYPTKEEKWLANYCQRDMCQSCCITTALQFEVNVNQEQVDQCRSSCKNKFWI